MRRFHPDKKTLKQCHIYGMLAAHAKGRHLSFHTPGHKSGAWDITELSYSDTLSCPQGVIAQAELECAEILGADRSFFLTDGSTSGVLSMLHAASVRSLAFPKNAHKSVYNGCRILGITPVLLEVPTLSQIPLQPTREEMSEKIKAADALLLVTPDYYGNLADLAFARELCDREGKLLLADGAHGGHLHFQREIYAGTYADLWVDGVHKSLPALTQGAVVSARTPELSRRLKESVDIFRTTSPSYPILASVEYAVRFPRNEVLENEVFRFTAAWENRLWPGGDWTKLCVRLGSAEFRVQKQLEAKGIYAEFCDGNVLMFYLSPATRKRDFLRLRKELVTLFSVLPPPEPLGRSDRKSDSAPDCARRFSEPSPAVSASARPSAASPGLSRYPGPFGRPGESPGKKTVLPKNPANRENQITPENPVDSKNTGSQTDPESPIAPETPTVATPRSGTVTPERTTLNPSNLTDCISAYSGLSQSATSGPTDQIQLTQNRTPEKRKISGDSGPGLAEFTKLTDFPGTSDRSESSIFSVSSNCSVFSNCSGRPESSVDPDRRDLCKVSNQEPDVEQCAIEFLPPEHAIGRIAARTCGLFPPCTPLIFAGERVTEEAARLLKEAPNAFGLEEGKTVAVFILSPEKSV